LRKTKGDKKKAMNLKATSINDGQVMSLMITNWRRKQVQNPKRISLERKVLIYRNNWFQEVSKNVGL
jgi:hypothetical protein